MNGTEINNRLLEIKSVPGKNDKIEMLKESLMDGDFFWSIQMMLDPRVRFNVAKKTIDAVEKEATSSPDFIYDLFADPIKIQSFLDKLESREISGNETKNHLLTLRAGLNDGSWELLTKILLKKPDAGFTASSVNKARPETVWTFDCMLAHKFEEKRIKEWPVAVEPKYDGWRCLAVVKSDGKGNVKAQTFSRTGKPYTTLGPIERALEEVLLEPMENTGNFHEFELIFDGEIMSGSFNDTASAAGKKDVDAEDAVFRIFDAINGADWNSGKMTKPYLTRRDSICRVFGDPGAAFIPKLQVAEMWICHSLETVMQHNARIHAEGGEGVIVKPLQHLYERKRSHSWLKVKAFETHDLVITDMFEGEGKYAGKMGGVICDFDGVEVRVGGGWSDADREIMWNDQSSYIGRMIEVGAHEQTPDGSLRHPRFMRFRDDKHEALAA